MGRLDLVSQAVSDAEADMNTVRVAAHAISTAIGNVKPWLTPETWEGKAAAAWAGEWESFYRVVQNCLNDLPAAESDIVSAVQAQMTKVVRAEAQRRHAPKA
jgi:uncharacterized protein YukE